MNEHYEDLEIRPRGDEPLEEGVYAAKFVGYERVTGQFGEQLRLDFELRLPDGGTRKLPMYCSWSSSPSPKSKLYASLVALRGGQPLSEGEPVKLRELLGAECQAWLEHKTLSDGRVVEKLTKITPVKRKPAPQAMEPPFA